MAGVTEEGCIVYYFEMGLYSKWMRCKDVITDTKRLKKNYYITNAKPREDKNAGQDIYSLWTY